MTFFCTLKETDKGFRVIFNQRNEIHVLDRTKMTTLLTAQRERERTSHNYFEQLSSKKVKIFKSIVQFIKNASANACFFSFVLCAYHAK